MNQYALILGCEVNPIPYGCTKCPLPLCKYDDPQGYQNWQRRGRRAEVKAALQTGTVRQAALALGVTERTAFRYKAQLMARSVINA